MPYRLSKDVKNESLLLYTKLRDIHSTGIVFLQMVLGIDVVDRYPDVYTAIMSCKSSSHRSLLITNLAFSTALFRFSTFGYGDAYSEEEPSQLHGDLAHDCGHVLPIASSEC